MGTVNHIDSAIPPLLPGTKRQVRTVARATLSSRKNPLDDWMRASLATPLSLTSTWIYTVPCSPSRRLMGGYRGLGFCR